MGNNNTNSNLNNALLNKDDEFYTRYEDIVSELKHYRRFFEGKTVYLNCDDPRESEFFQYFSKNFNKLGLKKLISSCYKDSDSQNKAVWLEYTGDTNDGVVPSVEEIGLNEFDGNGDFRSEESIELLKQADIVVSNPPFSLFRDYVSQLVEYDKKFIAVGNYNAVSLKGIFPLIRDDKMRVGYSKRGMKFNTRNGVKEVNASWFTNLPVNKPEMNVVLHEEYSEEHYPYYDNYEAINVNRVADIPNNYSGVMGVPITYLERLNPNQFEVLGLSGHREDTIGIRTKTGKGDPRPLIDEKIKYTRVFIQNKELNQKVLSK